MDIPLLKSGNQNGNDNNTNKIARAIGTIIKSINHARNLSTQLANITSTGRLSASPILDTGGESLFDEDNYQVKFSRYTYMILFFKERKDVNMGVNIGVELNLKNSLVILKMIRSAFLFYSSLSSS